MGTKLGIRTVREALSERMHAELCDARGHHNGGDLVLRNFHMSTAAGLLAAMEAIESIYLTGADGACDGLGFGQSNYLDSERAVYQGACGHIGWSRGA